MNPRGLWNSHIEALPSRGFCAPPKRHRIFRISQDPVPFVVVLFNYIALINFSLLPHFPGNTPAPVHIFGVRIHDLIFFMFTCGRQMLICKSARETGLRDY